MEKFFNPNYFKIIKQAPTEQDPIRRLINGEDRKTRQARCYIAGPMTGYPGHNFEAFHKEALRLRLKGFDVISPAELEEKEGLLPRKSWEYYLRRDLAELVKCDKVSILKGWEKSRGARLEITVARALGMGLYDEGDGSGADLQYVDRLLKRSIEEISDTLNPDTKETILREAQRIVGGDRAKAYGHPKQDFDRTAKLWSAVLGKEVTATQVALCMIQVKVSRECNAVKRDNSVDIAGYAMTLSMVNEAEGKY